MRSPSIIFIAVLLASAAALPHPGPLRIPIRKRSTLARDGIFNLDAARSHIAYSEQKYLGGVAALEHRTGAPEHSSRSHAPTRRAVGADSLSDDGNEMWYGTISVGSPAVEYKVLFDTGSADLFLPASNCGSTCDGHTVYNPNASSSAVDLHQSFSLTYGDGSTVSGEQYTDTVTIASFVAKNQTFGASTQYSTGFQIANFPSDGLMGMAFAEISVFQGSPVVQTLIAEGQLSDLLFAFNLASSGPELRIGGVDTSLYTGSFTYTPVTQQGFWQLSLDSINANNQAISKNVSAIVDTGTTLILGDTLTVGQFYTALNATDVGGGFYTMPCDAMPNVSITIGGKSFPVSAETFNLGSYNSSGNSCIGAVAATGSLGDIWIVGDVFLRNVYSVFDIGQLRVGFADLA
ncbi:aspartic peptidase domain-containing protein [Butyriboletus roseoflavus]|nr:aspartic peptidase domain-containing protein [Butyriboletus roseoflavus]